tara:strand:- start:232 stop:915 length:684 start_codon:yes stop_codon:yes gene_type:complete
MVLQSAGSAIKFSEIQDEFGGENPISLSEYYIGGDNVPATVTGTGNAGAFTAYAGGGVFILPFIASPLQHFSQEISKSFSFTQNTLGTAMVSTLLASDPTYTYTLQFDGTTIVTSSSTNGTAIFPGSVNGGAVNSVTYKAAFEASNNAANEVIVSSGGFDYQIGSNVFASRVTPVLALAGQTLDVVATDFAQVRRRTTGTQVTSNVNPNVPASGEVSMSDYYGGRDD